MQTIEDRFWDNVEVGAPDECWPWKLSRTDVGYGKFSPSSTKTVYAHRMAFYLTHGYWPEVCRHGCDHPWCCNPAHLQDGTHQLNSDDRDARGRTAKGERHGNSKLTTEAVREIRRLYDTGEWTQTRLGQRFGVSRFTVSDIMRGRNWRE